MSLATVADLHAEAKRLAEDLNGDVTEFTDKPKARGLVLAARIAMQGVESMLFLAMLNDNMREEA